MSTAAIVQTARQKRIVIRVRWSKKRGSWVVKKPSAEDAMYSRQTAAVLNAVAWARFAHQQGGLAQVVLHGKNGRIRWERTYGKDPRRSRG